MNRSTPTYYTSSTGTTFGSYYYGARYYHSELLASWLSVDPLLDKYPNVSPYNYCAGNPVKLVDPDGREIWITGENNTRYQYKNEKLYTKDGKLYEGGDKFVDYIKGSIDEMYKTNAGKAVVNRLAESKEIYTYKNEKCKTSGVGGGFSDRTNNIIVGGSKRIAIAHETFYAYQKDLGMTGRTVTREVGAHLFSSMVSLQRSWFEDGILGVGSYEISMNNLLIYGFNIKDYSKAVNTFFKESQAGQDYKQHGYILGTISENPPIKQFLPIP